MLNLTPHPITIRTDAGDVTLPPSGTVARVEMREHHSPYSDITMTGDCGGTAEIPVITRTPGGVTGLPTPVGYREYPSCIVSSMVLAALPSGTIGVYAPDTGPTAVRDDKGRIVAVTRLVAAS